MTTTEQLSDNCQGDSNFSYERAVLIKSKTVNNETEPIPATEWKLDNDSEISSQTKV